MKAIEAINHTKEKINEIKEAHIKGMHKTSDPEAKKFMNGIIVGLNRALMAFPLMEEIDE